MAMPLKEFVGRALVFSPELVPVPVDERLRHQLRSGGLFFSSATAVSFLFILIQPPMALVAGPLFLISCCAVSAWWTLQGETEHFTLANGKQLQAMAVLGALATFYRLCFYVLAIVSVAVTILGVLLVIGVLFSALSEAGRNH